MLSPCFPRSQNRDLGGPIFVQDQAVRDLVKICARENPLAGDFGEGILLMSGCWDALAAAVIVPGMGTLSAAGDEDGGGECPDGSRAGFVIEGRCPRVSIARCGLERVERQAEVLERVV